MNDSMESPIANGGRPATLDQGLKLVAFVGQFSNGLFDSSNFLEFTCFRQRCQREGSGLEFTTVRGG